CTSRVRCSRKHRRARYHVLNGHFRGPCDTLLQLDGTAIALFPIALPLLEDEALGRLACAHLLPCVLSASEKQVQHVKVGLLTDHTCVLTRSSLSGPSWTASARSQIGCTMPCIC